MIENNEFSFEIIERIATIETLGSGWTKEVNLISWNKHEPKIDIRSWDPEHERMTRGITLTQEEMERLTDAFVIWIDKKNTKEKQETDTQTYSVVDFPNFRHLYEQYMFREISKGQFAEKLGISRPILDKLIDEFTQKKGRTR